MQAYSDPERENDPRALPDLEIFYADKGELNACNEGVEDCDACASEARNRCDDSDDDEHTCSRHEAGYFYWYCFPGCMPDSDPHGPFATEDEALADAREWCAS